MAMDLSDDADGAKWRDRVLIEMAKARSDLTGIRTEIKRTRLLILVWFVLLPIAAAALVFLGPRG
jgi:hypothetical protein